MVGSVGCSFHGRHGNTIGAYAALKANSVIATYASDGGPRNPELAFQQLLGSAIMRFAYMYVLPEPALTQCLGRTTGALRPGIATRLPAIGNILVALS
jgi:hypothetical protein